jgi:hypothetical protein
VLACATLFGCGEVAGGPKPDAAVVMPMPCSQPICGDKSTVQACVDGGAAGTFEECADANTCSAGRCMSAECVVAAANHHSLAGCFFYTARPLNVASDAGKWMSFLITNPGTAEATVSLQHIDAGANWTPSESTAVQPGRSARLTISGSQISNVGVSPGAGLRLISDLPVTVAQIESDDSGEDALSTSGTMLLPVHVLGPHYRVIAYPQRTTPQIDALAGGEGGAARLLVVGTRPDTPVRFIAGPDGARVMGPDTIVMAGGETMTMMLGDGDVFQASSAGDADDLSGSEIFADLPVAVFSGNVSTAYGVGAPKGINSPDMVHEQIPPVGSWSLEYVAAALPPQADTCDTLLGVAGASVWRMLATVDGTTVTFAAPPGVSGLPEKNPITLAAGEVVELIVSGGDFSVKSSEPLLLAQGIDCEPTLALAVSADQWLSDLSFAVLPNFDQLIAVARAAGAPVMLDGVPISDTRFVSAGGTYEVARVSLTACPPRELVCTHRLTGEFGMTLRGMDVFSSYALTAPMWRRCLDRLDPNCQE